MKFGVCSEGVPGSLVLWSVLDYSKQIIVVGCLSPQLWYQPTPSPSYFTAQ